MEIKRVTYYSISVQDKPGELTRITRGLKEAHVDLAGLWGFGVGQGKARIFLVPKDKDHFKTTAAKAGWTVQEGISFLVTGEDQAGALVELLNQIAGQGINLHALDAVAVGGQFGCYIWAEQKDVESVGKILKV